MDVRRGCANRNIALPNLFVLRGLKNKPKFRCYASFTPKFSLLFQQVKGRERISRSAERDQRVAVGSQKTFEKVLSKLSKRVRLKPSNSDLSLLSHLVLWRRTLPMPPGLSMTRPMPRQTLSSGDFATVTRMPVRSLISRGRPPSIAPPPAIIMPKS